MLRRGAAVASGAALVLLVGLAVVRYQGPATEAEAASKERAAGSSAATSIKGLQSRVAAVMQAERKEGQIVRQVMVKKEREEVRLETAEDGLQATEENERETTGDSAKVRRDSHQSIQEIKDQIATATKRAEKAKAARKKLQKQLDQDLNLLAHWQFLAHAAAAEKAGKKKAKEGKSGVALAARAAGVRAVSGRGVGVWAAKTARAQESVLAGMEKQLLSLPKVRKALAQSLNANELKIASEVAKSLGAQFNITGLNDDMVAEVAVATAEKDQDIPLLADMKTPAVSAEEDVFMSECSLCGVERPCSLCGVERLFNPDEFFVLLQSTSSSRLSVLDSLACAVEFHRAAAGGRPALGL